MVQHSLLMDMKAVDDSSFMQKSLAPAHFPVVSEKKKDWEAVAERNHR